MGCMNRPNDHLVVLGIVPGFDKRLGIDVTMWRPIDKTYRKQMRLPSEQADLGRRKLPDRFPARRLLRGRLCLED